jgi:hypothetical protein
MAIQTKNSVWTLLSVLQAFRMKFTSAKPQFFVEQVQEMPASPTTTVKLLQATIHKKDDEAPIAQIVLNKYTLNADTNNRLPKGRMRGFQFIEGSMGSLTKHWINQDQLRLHIKDKKVSIRVSALPTDLESSGLLEFIYL